MSGKKAYENDKNFIKNLATIRHHYIPVRMARMLQRHREIRIHIHWSW